MDGSYVYLLLYVDDMLIAYEDISEINNLKAQLSKEFDMKDLGVAKKILGLGIHRDQKAGTIFFYHNRSILRMCWKALVCKAQNLLALRS